MPFKCEHCTIKVEMQNYCKSSVRQQKIQVQARKSGALFENGHVDSIACGKVKNFRNTTIVVCRFLFVGLFVHLFVCLVCVHESGTSYYIYCFCLYNEQFPGGVCAEMDNNFSHTCRCPWLSSQYTIES